MITSLFVRYNLFEKSSVVMPKYIVYAGLLEVFGVWSGRPGPVWFWVELGAANSGRNSFRDFGRSGEDGCEKYGACSEEVRETHTVGEGEQESSEILLLPPIHKS